MKFVKITAVTTAIVLILCSGTIGQAQTGVDPQRLASVREKLAQVAGVLDGLPESSKKRLSSGAQNLLKLAQGWEEVERALGNENAPVNQLRALSFALSDIKRSCRSHFSDFQPGH